MKKNVKKIKFKNKQIIKEDAADTALQGLSDISGDVKKVFSIFGNSFKRMFNITIVYVKDLLMAKFFYKTSLREVHLKHAKLQREFHNKNKAMLDAMSGAKDINSFLTIVSPGIKSFEVFMNTSPKIGEMLDELSTDSRKNWNKAVKKYYGDNPPNYLILDEGGMPYSDQEGTLLVNFVNLLKLVYTKEFVKSLDMSNAIGLSSAEQSKLITKFEKNIDKERRSKIISLNRSFNNDELNKIIDQLNKLLTNEFSFSDNETLFFRKIFLKDFIDTKQIILETKKDREIITIYNKLYSKRNSVEFKALQMLVNIENKENKVKPKKSEPQSDSTPKETEPEALNSSKKLVFNKNSILIKESKEDIDRAAIIIAKEFKSQFFKMYFINIYYYVESSSLNARITALYFSYINSIINAHKTFIEEGSLKEDYIQNAVDSSKANAQTCLTQLNSLETKLSDKIFDVTDALSKADDVLSKESFSKEVEQLKEYYNNTIKQIETSANIIIQNIKKINEASSSEIVNKAQSDLIKTLNEAKAFVDVANPINEKYQQEKQGLSKVISTLDYESIIETIGTIKKDIDFYKKDSTFITDESINIVDTNKETLNSILSKYQENDINKTIEFLKTQIEVKSKELENIISKEEDTGEDSSTEESQSTTENPGDEEEK